MARHENSSIIKFADDTTVIGLISNNEASYMQEVRDLTVWCHNNNLFLNVNKTKEIIIDFRKNACIHKPL